MAGVEKMWEFREDVEIIEEEEVLKTRGSKKRLDHGNGEEESKKDEGQVVVDVHKSVFFDPTKGLWECRHCDWTYRLSCPCRDDILNHQGYCQFVRDLKPLAQIESFHDSPNKVSDLVTEVAAKTEVIEVVLFGAQKDKTNGTSSPENKEHEQQDAVIAQETNHTSNSGKLENDSNSNVCHEVSNIGETKTSANESAGLKLIANISEGKASIASSSVPPDSYNNSVSRTSVDEIEEEKPANATKGKVNIEEYDLEKILDEQETHDLYCPNCNSCITRRVILRKRKRTVRHIVRDEPPKKQQHAEPSANAPAETVVQRRDQDSPIFRCLSCFIFFIPTGKEVNAEVQVQQASTSRETSDNCAGWLLSCFQSGDSPRNGTDQDPAKKPLLTDIQSTGDTTSSVEDRTSPAQSQAITGKSEQSVGSETTTGIKITNGKIEQETRPLINEVQGATVIVSSMAAQTSSVVSKISRDTSKTGPVRTEVTHVSTTRQDKVRQEQIPLSNPANEVSIDATCPIDKADVLAPSKHVSFHESSTVTSDISSMPTLGEISQTPMVPGNNSTAPTHVVLRVDPPPPAIISDDRDGWDVLKAIVYGGLIESITSLSVVSASAASSAKTMDVFILGMANLIGGLTVIFHNLMDLKNLGEVEEKNKQVGRYWEQLGRRSRWQMHMVVAILSYIIFGLLPPVIYGFSFRESDNRENKMMAIAGASLLCIAMLAIGKAHVKRQRTYKTTLLYYLTIAVSTSGLSYVAGVFIKRILAHFGLVDQAASPPAPPSLFPHIIAAKPSGWASY